MATKNKNLSDYNSEGVFYNNQNLPVKIGIAVSEWNTEITDSLLNAAIETLNNFGFTNNDIIIKKVPGSFELPLAADFLIKYANVEAVICLGCIIQGETRHFDFVAQGVTKGIMDVMLKNEIPVSFGVLTTQNQQQALDRAGGKHGNKGIEAAIAVLKMLQIKKCLNEKCF